MSNPSTTLGLAKIGAPGQIRKITLALEPAIASELDRYAAAYEASYGERVEIDVLIPHMLGSYMATDRGFKKWKASTGGA